MEAALVTTTEFDRTTDRLDNRIDAAEALIAQLRTDFEAFKIAITNELHESVADLNNQLIGNRSYLYSHTMPVVFPWQEFGGAYWNQWFFIDLSAYWNPLGITHQLKSVRFHFEVRLQWLGPLEGPDGFRSFGIEMSGVEGPTPISGQPDWNSPALTRRVRVTGAKDDSTYCDTATGDVLVPVFYKNGRPHIRIWFWSDGGPVSRKAQISISGWKY